MQLLHRFSAKLALHIQLCRIEASSIGLLFILFLIVIVDAVPHDGCSGFLHFFFLFLLALGTGGSADRLPLLRFWLSVRLFLILSSLCLGGLLCFSLLLLLHHASFLLLLTPPALLLLSLLLLTSLFSGCSLSCCLLLSPVIASLIGWWLFAALTLTVVGKNLCHDGATVHT